MLCEFGTDATAARPSMILRALLAQIGYRAFFGVNMDYNAKFEENENCFKISGDRKTRSIDIQLQ